jgi:hypothetical protein
MKMRIGTAGCCNVKTLLAAYQPTWCTVSGDHNLDMYRALFWLVVPYSLVKEHTDTIFIVKEYGEQANKQHLTCLACSLTMKMGAIYFSETTVNF